MSETSLLTARGLGVTLSGRVVLKDVSLALSPGHLVALVGPDRKSVVSPNSPAASAAAWRWPVRWR